MNKRRLIGTCYLIQILLVFSLVSRAGASEIPNDARLLLEKREEAVKAIDRRLVEELEKLKVAHTKRGDLESANAIVALIKQYQADLGIAKDEPSQIARLVGVWRRDTDKTTLQFNPDGTGMWNNRDMFRVSYNAKSDQFEIKSPRWEVNTMKFDDAGTTLIGKNSGGAFKLTRIK
jgi:hypothetical protein